MNLRYPIFGVFGGFYQTANRMCGGAFTGAEGGEARCNDEVEDVACEDEGFGGGGV